MKNPLPLVFLLVFAVSVFVEGCTMREKAANPEASTINREIRTTVCKSNTNLEILFVRLIKKSDVQQGGFT